MCLPAGTCRHLIDVRDFHVLYLRWKRHLCIHLKYPINECSCEPSLGSEVRLFALVRETSSLRELAESVDAVACAATFPMVSNVELQDVRQQHCIGITVRS